MGEYWAILRSERWVSTVLTQQYGGVGIFVRARSVAPLSTTCIDRAHYGERRTLSDHFAMWVTAWCRQTTAHLSDDQHRVRSFRQSLHQPRGLQVRCSSRDGVEYVWNLEFASSCWSILTTEAQPACADPQAFHLVRDLMDYISRLRVFP